VFWEEKTKTKTNTTEHVPGAEQITLTDVFSSSFSMVCQVITPMGGRTTVRFKEMTLEGPELKARPHYLLPT
jgi:hypothetical protein